MSRRLEMSKLLVTRKVARETYVLRFDMRLSAPVQPGQFAMVHPLRAGCLLPRPFSILDATSAGLDILVKVVGKGSAALAALSPGDGVRLFAPLGSGFDAAILAQTPQILVAGGVGVVPLHLLSRRLAAAKAKPIALFGAREPEDLPRELFAGEAVAWQLWVERNPSSDCRVGLVTQGLLEALEQQPDAVVASCGPTPMMQAVARICAQQRRPLWLCLEEQMGCGAGVCRSCVIADADAPRMRTVCKEGPVFRVDQIRFLDEVA